MADAPYDKTRCDENIDSDQPHLCLERRAADAAVNQANWARRNFYLGIAGTVAITLTLLASLGATYYARQSSMAAKVAADAAWANTNITRLAMIDAEWPVLFPRVGDERNTFPYAPGSSEIATVFPEVIYSFVNYGKTPAQIDLVVADIFIQPEPPEPPSEIYGQVPIFAPISSSNMPIIMPEAETGMFRLQMVVPLNDRIHTDIATKDTFIWITGFIQYLNILGGVRRTYFCRQFDPDFRLFIPFGSKRYNRHQDRTDDEIDRRAQAAQVV